MSVEQLASNHNVIRKSGSRIVFGTEAYPLPRKTVGERAPIRGPIRHTIIGMTLYVRKLCALACHAFLHVCALGLPSSLSKT